MVLPLAGAALLLGGTGASALGTYQRDRATRRALKNYSGALNEHLGQERDALGQEQGILSGLAAERQGGVGQYLQSLKMAQHPGTDDGFAADQAGALTGVKELTKGMDGTYAYSGAPRTAAATQQGNIGATDRNRFASALMADWEQKQIQEREAASQHRMTLGDILRQSKGASITQRFQLAKALRDLDWQRKTAAMQNHLDEAQRKGQWLNILGGLGQQGGGMLMMAGMDGGAGPGGMEGAPAGATDLGSFQSGQFTDPQMPGQWS